MRHYARQNELPGFAVPVAEGRALTYQERGYYKAAAGQLYKAVRASYAEGNFEKAITLLEHACELGLGFNNRRDRNIKDLGRIKANIAFLYVKLGNYDFAKMFAEQASREHLIACYGTRSKGEMVANEFWFGGGKGADTLMCLTSEPYNFGIYFERPDVAGAILQRTGAMLKEKERIDAFRFAASHSPANDARNRTFSSRKR